MAILGLFLLSSCSPSDRAAADKLNTLSYACHYRDIDSTEHYARQVLSMSQLSDDQHAEALNNLAFVSMVCMKYDEAGRQLREALALTDNQVELLVAEVQMMRLCQRRSDNRAFYEHREQAMKHLGRINEERSMLSERLLQRLVYAESELAIVNSTYYYYVGLERQSIEALQALNADEVRRDTAQYLNYLYNVGAGGIITQGSPEDIRQEEMDFLDRCLAVAQRQRYPYFEAQAKEAQAEHTGDMTLAKEALELFRQYGDIYQIAGAYRTLASCYHAVGDEAQALECLAWSLGDDRIKQAPDLVASIYEQMSVVYSAVDDKVNSDYYRNHYLDLQEQTRQDRELEARAGLLDKAVTQLNWMIWAVVGAIVLLLLLLWFFNYQNKKRKEDHQLDDLLELKNEEVAEARLRVEKQERRHLEQRAKVSLVNSITPFIDRILYTIDHLPLTNDHLPLNIDHLPLTTEHSAAQTYPAENNVQCSMFNVQLDYIRELTDKINEQNDLLTQWIQLRQGELSLHIESFPLQPLFDMMVRGKTAFAMKGITLDVQPTGACVKADRVLTLFMLNTLADNARKFTERGGSVTIAADEQADYVEVSISDTGCGMTRQQLAHVFDPKPIVEESHHKVQTSSLKPQTSHGFGLMNCKGIIEKYRKLSQLFSVCQLSAESEQGRGSRFYFRLPVGGVRCWVIGVGCWVIGVGCWLMASGAWADNHQPLPTTHHPLDYAHIYADSAYFCNINGTYDRTLQFADSCRKYLNLQYLSTHPKDSLLLTADGDTNVTPPEIQWLHDSVDVNYQIILDIRNESAVAALALHQWQLYAYNNKVYTQLFKEMSADNTLADYCRTMQQSQTNKRIAVILLIVILLLIVPTYYMAYYRHRLYDRHRRESLQLANIEMADDELRRAELEAGKLHVVNAVLDNCLSTLKHETMYYPSRIRQLVDSGDVGLLGEVTRYYRDLYGMLSEQAMNQLEQVKLHVHHIDFYGQPVLGDENALRYLFELLPGKVTTETKDDRYVVFHISLSSPLQPFTSLLCRQIVRDHGEATHRRGCGISIDGNNVKLTLPRYNGKV